MQEERTKVVVSNAYCRIKALRFDHPDSLYIEVGVYQDEKSEPAFCMEYGFSVKELGGKEAINAATAYLKLKTLPEWEDAQDA